MPDIVFVKKHEASDSPGQESAKQQAGKEAGRCTNGSRRITSIHVC